MEKENKNSGQVSHYKQGKKAVIGSGLALMSIYSVKRVVGWDEERTPTYVLFIKAISMAAMQQWGNRSCN